MTDKQEVEKFYQVQAKRIIDMMFDSKVFNEKTTRDDMQGFENLIAYHFESHAKTTRKCVEFTNSLKHLKD